MEMIIQRHGPEKDTARFFPQDAMHLAHGDGRIRQMLQYLRHHQGIESFIAKRNSGGEIHFHARDAGGSRDLERFGIDVHSEPANPADQLDQCTAAATHIHAQTRCIMMIGIQAFLEKFGFDFLVLTTTALVIARLAVLLVKLANQPGAVGGFIEEEAFGELRRLETSPRLSPAIG